MIKRKSDLVWNKVFGKHTCNPDKVIGYVTCKGVFNFGNLVGGPFCLLIMMIFS